MRKITTRLDKLRLDDKFEVIFEKPVTRFGNGAKIDCPKEHIGKKAYVIIRKDD